MVFAFGLQVTQWLDASHVYGSSDSQAEALRQWQGGRLRMLNLEGRDLLPLDDEDSECIGFDRGLHCFLTGLSLIWIEFDH